MLLLETLFDAMRADERILIKGIKHGRSQQILVGNVATAYAAAQKLSAQGAEAYFGVIPRLQGKPEELGQIRFVWADLDIKDFGSSEDLEAAVCRYPVPPTFEVFSGHGYHYYWQLDRSVSAETAQTLMQTIWRALGEGTGGRVYNPKWVLRIPGTMNHKDPAHPIPVVERKVREQAVYYVPDLLSLARVPMVVVRKLQASHHRGYPSRSERDYSVVAALVALDVVDSTIHTLFQYLPVGDRYREPNGRSYLDRTIAAARDRRIDHRNAFVVKEDALFLRTQKEEWQVATFSYHPKQLLKVVDEGEDWLLGDIKAYGYLWENIPLPKSAFSSAQALLRRLPVASWQWLAGDREVRLLLAYLMQRLIAQGMPHTRGTSVVGRHQNYWVAPGLTFDAGRTYDSLNTPYVYLPTGRETLTTDYTFPDEETYGAQVRQISALMPQLNQAAVMVPTIGWFCATPIKPLLLDTGERFPLLNVYGTQGSGKSTLLLRVLHPLLGQGQAREHPCKTKVFVSLSMFASTNAAPISFGEFRATLGSTKFDEFNHLVQLAYDAGYDARGRPDQTTQVYPLLAPHTLSGEDMIGDPAQRERAVIVNMHKPTIAPRSPAYEAYHACIRLPLTSFAGRYVQATLRETKQTIRERFDRAFLALEDTLQASLPNRVHRNLAVVLVGLELYNEHVTRYGGTPVPWDRNTFAALITDSQLRLTSGRTRVLADDFIEDVLAYVERWPPQLAFFVRYDDASNILWFSLTGALGWWAAKRRRENLPMLQRQAIKMQLKELTDTYVVDERRLTTEGVERMCFGILVARCAAEGLDVPTRLHKRPSIEIVVDPVEY